MFRAVLCLVLVACGSPGAQAPVVTPEQPAPPPPTPPAPPAPTAEQQFAKWLEAFNSGDRDKMLAIRQDVLAPELAKTLPPIEGILRFREDIGGFEVKKVEESTSTRYAALVKERSGDGVARAVVEIQATAPHRITKIDILLVPTPPDLLPPRLDEAAAIAALKAGVESAVAKDRFAGAVLVAKHGKPVFAQAYGMADRDKKIANTLATRFRIGSMNKMFTAVATLQLVQAKKIKLDDTIGKHLPDYPNKDIASKVTIHQLLTHTGGTGDIFGPEYDTKRLELRTLEDYVKLYGNRAPEHGPGEKFQYSNYGFLLLGVIITKVAKQSYYDRVQASVFKPAGMTSTSSPFEDKPMAGRSIAYTKDSGAWADARDTHPIRATSAGGGDSTVEDLLKFANALTANKLLDAEHTKLLVTGKVDARGAKYAYGFMDDDDGVHCVGHGGGAPGMNGELFICDSGYTIAVLANLDPPAASRIASFIRARLPAK